MREIALFRGEWGGRFKEKEVNEKEKGAAVEPFSIVEEDLKRTKEFAINHIVRKTEDDDEGCS